ncbi:MAG: sulfatase-like hydrolase/transferase [Casimicrobiaceae bacterium]
MSTTASLRDPPKLHDAKPGDHVSVTVLICSHDRRDLLARTIDSLNRAARPEGASIELFVVANACRDGTHPYLEAYGKTVHEGLPLRWLAEPQPGKSNALNRAFREDLGEVVAFVDDDHRVDAGYLENVVAAARQHPDAGLFCGRIIPDWDGSEPPWVHDEGQYRIYPLPVPRFDLGDEPAELTFRSSVPGGGNLVARREAIRVTGNFATELGPIGHDLGGAEDLDWVRRSLRSGMRLRYCPGIVQFHYVDSSRLRLDYVTRKALHRSQSTMRLDRRRTRVPAYMWRKLLEYLAFLVFTLDAGRRRFFIVRFAAALGEIQGILENRIEARRRAFIRPSPHDWLLRALLVGGVGTIAAAAWITWPLSLHGVVPVAATAALGVLLMVVKSVRDLSRTGPRISNEILGRYRLYATYALGRLALTLWLTLVFFGAGGVIAYGTAVATWGVAFDPWIAALASVAGMAIAGIRQLIHKLATNPGLIIASWQYRISRLNGWRDMIVRHRIDLAAQPVLVVLAALVAAAVVNLGVEGAEREASAVVLVAIGYGCLIAWAGGNLEPGARRSTRKGRQPNILMIGSDTLRADRILNPDYGRRLTPAIEELARRGTYFSQCYVPCARTAPSLISLFSGTWPHTHGVRDNFVAGPDTRLPIRMLPERLREQGYRTVAVSDWCGADLAKFSFGFDIADVPDDQWDLKFLIRQGPKDLRLLLSLFCHNRFGRHVLPEVYYLGGVPQTTEVGLRAREVMSRLATIDDPFLLNIFISTTHPPFASESPFGEMFASPDYHGESKFAMARLNDPFDIIRRQGDSRQEFDLEQIIDLYDGCVARFDAEVARLLAYLTACGLAEDTIVMIYSDHGMEFFEHDTWGQGNSAVGDFSPRIPLLIADPRNPVERRCDAVVRSIDVAPTLADLVGCDFAGPEGISLRPLMDGRALPQELPAFNETGIWITAVPGLPQGHLCYPDLLELLDVEDAATGTLAVKAHYSDQVIRAKDRMIRHGRWKLVYQPLEHGTRLQLFDLREDPGCTNDLHQREQGVTAQLWYELRRWMMADPVMAVSLRTAHLSATPVAATSAASRV